MCSRRKNALMKTYFQDLILLRNSMVSCWNEYPSEYEMDEVDDRPYSMANCQSICKAKHFVEKCRCTPAIHNVASSFPECTPLEIYQCIHQLLSNNQSNRKLRITIRRKTKHMCESKPQVARVEFRKCQILNWELRIFIISQNCSQLRPGTWRTDSAWN